MCGVSQSGWYMLSCWHMTFIWYIFRNIYLMYEKGKFAILELDLCVASANRDDICWHMTFIWYIQKYVSYAWKRKVCYFGGWFMCCVSRRPWEQPGQASCLGYRYLDIWPLERTCVDDDDDDDDDDHDDDDEDGDDGEDNNDDGSSVCKALSQQEPQVNEALLCRVCSAMCKVQSGKLMQNCLIVSSLQWMWW